MLQTQHHDDGDDDGELDDDVDVDAAVLDHSLVASLLFGAARRTLTA